MAQVASSLPPHLASANDNDKATEMPVAGKEETPLFLVLSRKGLVHTELRNPHTGDLVYRIRDTGRGSLSSKPDYEFYRPVGGEIFVGSIRFGKTSTDISMPLTGHKAKGLEKVKLQHLQGGARDFVWKTVKSERKKVKDRWFETNDDGRSEIWTKEEVIVLELVDAADPNSQPICAVRLINTQPAGRFEIWAKDAWINHGGNWNALDELVVSAYANMEKAKRELMGGLDPSSWRGAAFG